MLAPKVARSQANAPPAVKKPSARRPSIDEAGFLRDPADVQSRAHTAMWDFGRIPLHPTTPGSGDSLTLAPLGGRFEQQAEQIADHVAGGSERRGAAALTAPFQASKGTPPAAVHRALGGPGYPMNPEDRRFFEPRFGRDLSHVRLHAGDEAASAARSINALAYAAGSHIVFGRSQYAPQSPGGRRLLAHELAHVVEHGQPNGRSTLVHRAPGPGAVASIPFSVEIHSILTNDQLVIEFVRQYRRLATDAEAVALQKKEKWHLDGARSVTQADVDKTYVLIHVFDATVGPADPAKDKERDKKLKALSASDQQAINQEADQEFWQKTNYKVRQALTNKGDDKQMAETWKRVRGELIDKRAAIDALPPDIRTYMASEDAPTSLAPADYETALRIVSKLSKLSAAELAEYKSRTTATAADWFVYEASLDRYIAERSEKTETAKERAHLQTRLYGLDALYDRYRVYLSMIKTSAIGAGASAMSPQAAGMALGSLNAQEKIRSELEADLIKAGIPDGIAGLEKLIHSYEQNFEKETLGLASTMLEQYEHTLWLQQERYRKPAESQSLYQAISQSAAAADYSKGDQIRADHAQTMPMTLDEMAEQSYWVGERNKAVGSGESKMRGVGSGGVTGTNAHPLLQNSDFDREALSHAQSGADAQAMMLAYIAARQQDIVTTRQNLAKKPTMIYGLNDLLKAAFKVLNVNGSPLYGKIIHNHISDVHWTEAIPKLILAAIAIGAGLLTGGTGAVAVLAAAGTLGIGAYQALDSFREYEQGTAAAGAQLLSDAPSFAWVIVAVVGAGADLAVLGATIKAALGAMQPAVKAFNEGGKLEKLADDLAELEKLSTIDAGMRAKVLKAAAAQLKYRESLKGALGAASNMNMIFGPAGVHELASLVYSAAKKGAVAFDQFMLEMKAAKAIDESTLAVEDLARFKVLFEEAKTAATDIEIAGKALSLTDEQVAGFLNIWGKTPGLTLDELKIQMKAWEATKQGGVPTMALGKNSMVVDENVTIAFRKDALRQKTLDPSTLAKRDQMQSGEEALLGRMKDFKDKELRVPQAVTAKEATTLEGFDITVARDSKDYKGVMSELDRVSVGSGKGVEDRNIVADVFFAKAEPGVTPTFATHDPGVYRKLYVLSGKDPQKLGKPLAQAIPGGFDVTIKANGVDRTIRVIPLPNKPLTP